MVNCLHSQALPTDPPRGPSQDSPVANDKRTAECINFSVLQRFDNYLWSNACRIAQSNCEQRQLGFSHYFPPSG
jgi:hypothetical protein